MAPRSVDDANREEYDASAFWDEHSLDIQRAYDIICWVAGSSQEAYDLVAQGELIGESRLVRCPAEYRQQVDGWFALLRPYARAGSAATDGRRVTSIPCPNGVNPSHLWRNFC